MTSHFSLLFIFSPVRSYIASHKLLPPLSLYLANHTSFSCIERTLAAMPIYGQYKSLIDNQIKLDLWSKILMNESVICQIHNTAITEKVGRKKTLAKFSKSMADGQSISPSNLQNIQYLYFIWRPFTKVFARK